MRWLFLVSSLSLASIQAVNAAECAYYQALIEDGDLERAESTLNRDKDNRACAYHLSEAYLARGDKEQALRWLNYARLFAYAEQDPELYPLILYRKLLMDPDSDSDAASRGYPLVQDYDPQRDLGRLEGLSPVLASKLKEEARLRLEDELRYYLTSPWRQPCPSGEGQGFWASRVQDVASRTQQVCRAVNRYESLEGSPQSQAVIEDRWKALEELRKLGVDVDQRELPLRQLREYYRLEDAARASGLSSQRRAELLADALNALARARGRDTEKAEERRRKFRLMAEMEDELGKARGRPSPETVSSWRRDDRRLNHILPNDYRLALDLLDLHQACLDSPGRISDRHPCRLFLEDERWANVRFAESTLTRLRRDGEEKLESRIANNLDVAESLLTEENLKPSDISNSELIDFLDLLEESYSKQLDSDRLTRLRAMALFDRALINVTKSPSDPATVRESLFRMEEHSKNETAPLYIAALSLVRAWAECLGEDLDLPAETDACPELLDSPQWREKVRRREDLEVLKAEAQEIVDKKIKNAVEAINRARTAPMDAATAPEYDADELVRILEVKYKDYVDHDRLAALKTGAHIKPENVIGRRHSMADWLSWLSWPSPRRWPDILLAGALAMLIVLLAIYGLGFLSGRRKDDADRADTASLVDLKTDYENSGIRVSNCQHVLSPPPSTFYDLIKRNDGSYAIYLVEVAKEELNESWAFETALRIKRVLCPKRTGWGHGEAEAQLDQADELLHKEGIEAKMFFVEIHPARMVLSYASTGLPPLYVLRHGKSEPIRLNAFGHNVIGKGYAVGNKRVVREHNLEHGDTVFLFNNGVRDTKNKDNKTLSSKKLVDAVRSESGSPSRIIEVALDTLEQHSADVSPATIQMDWDLIACRVESLLVAGRLDSGIPALDLDYTPRHAPQLAENGSLSKTLSENYVELLANRSGGALVDDCILHVKADSPDSPLAKMLHELLDEIRKRDAVLHCVDLLSTDFDEYLDTYGLTSDHHFRRWEDVEAAKRFILGEPEAGNENPVYPPQPTDPQDDGLMS